MSSEYKNARKIYLEFSQGPKYIDNPEFVKTTINREYWEVADAGGEKKEITLGLWILIIVSGLTIVVSAVVLIVLFKCKPKSDSNDETEEALAD